MPEWLNKLTGKVQVDTPAASYTSSYVFGREKFDLTEDGKWYEAGPYRNFCSVCGTKLVWQKEYNVGFNPFTGELHEGFDAEWLNCANYGNRDYIKSDNKSLEHDYHVAYKHDSRTYEMIPASASFAMSHAESSRHLRDNDVKV